MTETHEPVDAAEAELQRARRQKAGDLARAANQRQGYVLDPVYEAAKARYIAGEITMDELRAQTIARFKRS